MDAFELLKTDHRKVATLFERLEEASGKEKLRIFNQIKKELEVHTHIEEKIFYPALEKPQETHDLTLESYEEHKVVKTLLAELSGAKSADDEWQAKAKVLRENVEHHVEEEEDELFSKADDALSDDEIETLGEKMAAEKARKLGVSKRAVKKQTGEKGIVARIKEFVGLSSEPASKKAAPRKTAAKKKSAPKATTKSSKKAKAAKARVRPTKGAKKSRSSGTKKSSTKRARPK